MRGYQGDYSFWFSTIILKTITHPQLARFIVVTIEMRDVSATHTLLTKKCFFCVCFLPFGVEL